MIASLVRFNLCFDFFRRPFLFQIVLHVFIYRCESCLCPMHESRPCTPKKPLHLHLFFFAKVKPSPFPLTQLSFLSQPGIIYGTCGVSLLFLLSPLFLFFSCFPSHPLSAYTLQWASAGCHPQLSQLFWFPRRTYLQRFCVCKSCSSHTKKPVKFQKKTTAWRKFLFFLLLSLLNRLLPAQVHIGREQEENDSLTHSLKVTVVFNFAQNVYNRKYITFYHLIVHIFLRLHQNHSKP